MEEVQQAWSLPFARAFEHWEPHFCNCVFALPDLLSTTFCTHAQLRNITTMTNQYLLQGYARRDIRRHYRDRSCIYRHTQECPRQTVSFKSTLRIASSRRLSLIDFPSRDWPIATHFLTLPDKVCYSVYCHLETNAKTQPSYRRSYLNTIRE